jgi:hypothetical protein
MSLFTKEGFRALRWVYGVALAGVGVAVFLVGGSYFYWQSEKKNGQQSVRTLQELRTRLESAKRERDDLRDSEQTYKVLTSRGVFVPEQRLDLIEAMAALKARHRLLSLEYELSAQRPLKLAGGTSLPAIDAMGSRIRLKFSAQHDGDMVAFLDEFARLQRGFFPLDRCTLRRSQDNVGGTGSVQKQDASAASALPATSGALSRSAPVAKPVDPVGAILEAECTMEWITLRDKRSQLAAEMNAGKPS